MFKQYVTERRTLQVTIASSGLMDLLITATIDYLCLQIAAGLRRYSCSTAGPGLALDDYQRLVIQPHNG
jgi:hypothetical protein